VMWAENARCYLSPTA